MDRASARQYVLNQPMKTQNLPTPWWPELDGSVYLQDIPTSEERKYEDLLSGPDDSLYLGSLICACTYVRDMDNPDAPGQPLFEKTDREQTLARGMTENMPLIKAIRAFLGTGKSPQAATAAAKND